MCRPPPGLKRQCVGEYKTLLHACDESPKQRQMHHVTWLVIAGKILGEHLVSHMIR